jgi:hypothetical protein
MFWLGKMQIRVTRELLLILSMPDTNFREIGGRLPETLPSTTVRVTELNRVFSSGAGTQAAERARNPSASYDFLSAWERCVFEVAVVPEAWSQSPSMRTRFTGYHSKLQRPG